MSDTDESSSEGAETVFRQRAARYEALAQAEQARAQQVSFGRLISFLAIVVFVSAGFSQDDPVWLSLAGASTLVFVGLVLWHARVLGRRDEAGYRRDVHQRHLQRLGAEWVELAPSGAIAPGHPYASDLDLCGAGSLCQRIDVSHTVRGEATLAAWLGAPASVETIAARQEAITELAEQLDVREGLEAAAAREAKSPRIDPAPFLAFVQREAWVRGGLVAAMFVLPLITLGLFVAYGIGKLPGGVAWGALGVQALLAFGTQRRCADAFQLVAARRGYVESLARMLAEVEAARFEAPLLQDLQKRVSVGGKPPSEWMARLDRWAGFAELYTQFPIHLVVNVAVLWDLHVLRQLERWNADVGEGLGDAFAALGELEALSSFAGLLHADPDASLPEVVSEARPLEAEGLAHPLLLAGKRVANDVRMPAARSSALIVTGSNMAGKSTLLRSVGLNLALAFAGGPVVARRFVTSPLRLRASMRVDDDLQQGASYFHAELTRLRTVVAEAGAEPPIFFLLDELLRGTNAKARHLGARAVLAHLLDAGGCGIAATHDIALSEVADERPHVRNVHFTDVMEGDEMIFDYRLREGVVRTSNALRLLELAGIAIDDIRAADT